MESQNDKIYQLCLSRCTRDDEKRRFQEEWKILHNTNTFSILSRFLHIINCLEGKWFVRGSAGCSMTMYLLGGTLFHPIDYDLSFERFTNIHRKTLGDIDIDVIPSIRPNIFTKIARKFPGQVGRLSNRVCFRERSARRFTKDIEKRKQLEGQFRFYSLHVGGLCFWDHGIPTKNVLKVLPTNPLPQLSLDKYDVQKEKIFKFDILNNNALGIIYQIDPSFDWERFRPELCVDNRVWECLQKGDTIGILYGESPMMKRCLQQIRPSTILELGLCFSLIRPMNRRVRYRLDKDPSYAEYVKKMKEPYFDDDWIRWLSERHRLSMADADALRRRMAKDPNETKIKGYGFCRSHALHYALLIYIQSYYKVYFPLQFYRAVLNEHVKGTRMYDKWVYILDAFHHDVLLDDIPLRKKKKTSESFVIDSKRKCLIPREGRQRRLFPVPILQQIQQSGGFFITKKGMSFKLFHGRVACHRKLTSSIHALHSYDAYLGRFVDIVLSTSSHS